MDMYKGTIPILEYTSQYRDMFHPKGFRTGAEPRDLKLYPKEMYDPPSEMDVYQETDWDALYDEMEKNKSSLEHLYLRGGKPAFTNLDQNGDGYCWHYSSGHAAMFLGLANHEPIVRLNPHAGAAIIKGGKDEGGWCGLSGKFIEEVGIA